MFVKTRRQIQKLRVDKRGVVQKRRGAIKTVALSSEAARLIRRAALGYVALG